jgi:hypothetical protein
MQFLGNLDIPGNFKEQYEQLLKEKLYSQTEAKKAVDLTEKAYCNGKRISDLEYWNSAVHIKFYPVNPKDPLHKRRYRKLIHKFINHIK